MKTEAVVKKVTYTCDYCWTNSEDWKGRYNVNSLESTWTRLWEKQSSGWHREVRHYTDRVSIDFCCLLCIKKYLAQSIDLFVAELSPIKDKKHKEVFDM